MKLKENEGQGEYQIFELEDVKNIIREEIEKKTRNLDSTILCIQKASNTNLSTIDHAFITRKYIKYCSKLWLQEVINFLIEVRKDKIKQQDVAQEIISKISAIQNINQIPNCLRKVQYYDLLLEHHQLMDKETERIILDNFKARCFEQLIGCNENARNELLFLEALNDFLNSFETVEIITKKLLLSDFCNGHISFNKILKEIINLKTEDYGKELASLQNAAKLLQDQDHFLLLNEIREIIEDYTAPVKILNKRLDNRSFIEIKGRIININEILAELENQLQNTKDCVDEVHFVGTDSVHIRVNLQKNIWNGKNIVIYTNVIKVHNVVTWDVSGKDANHAYTDNAGTSTDGHGKNGVDGYAGDSGGNVKIFAKSIENPENWTIVSNGGGGGEGQDGGNGKDGANGKGIQTSEFRTNFPSIVSFACPYTTRIKTLNNMVDHIKNLGSVETSWRSSNNVFIRVKTNQGNEITFSYCCGSFTTRYQAFLIYGGSLGSPGGHGGNGGLGGQGGYSGEVDVCNPHVTVKAKSGQNGNKGKGGLYGNYGINGWDIGYIDYQNWRDTIYYGSDKQSKLTVDYYSQDNSEGTRIWCPYHDKYAEMRVKPNIQRKEKMYEERKDSKIDRALQKQALPVRKNTVISSTFAVYSDYCKHVDDILQRLKINLEQTECNTLQSMHECEDRKEKQEINIEINTRRCATSTCLSEDKKPSIQSPPIVVKTFKEVDKESKDNLIETLKSSKSFKDWVAIKNKSVSYSDLKEICIIFDEIRNEKKNKLQKSEIQSVEGILIWKYKFAILQEIAMQLLSHPCSSKIKDEQSSAVNMTKYFIVTKKVNINVSHNILGTLNQYIFDDGEEQRQKICKFFQKHLPNEDNKIFKNSIKIFILESENTGKINPDVEKHRNQYLEYFQKKSENVNASLQAIAKEVQRHKGLYDLWIEYLRDKSKGHILEERIKKDKFLFGLYRRFKNEFNKEYDWSICCTNKNILTEHNKHMQESGTMSPIYRELLASLFDVNIQIYRRDENNPFSLLYNHNKSSKRSIYLLERNNEYTQLEIDENYLQLDKERKWKNILHARILKNIELFTQRKELDEYLNCQTLSSSDVHDFKLEWPLFNGEDRNEENVHIDQILNYFSDETDERPRMRQRLEKLKYKITGQPGLLYCIAQKFLNEGRHISTQVLYYLINSILNNVIQNGEKSILFHWIIISYSQRYWLVELIFLQLENYFKKPLTAEQLKWRERLSKIDNNILMLFKVKLDRELYLSVQCIDEILYLLSSIPNEVKILEDLGLSEWPYFLKEEYWMSKLSGLVKWEDNDELLTATYYVLSVENNFGTTVVEKLLEIIQAKKEKFTSKNLINILYNFHNENWELNESTLKTFCESNLTDGMKMMEEKINLTGLFEERNIVQLIPLIKDNSHTFIGISDILPMIKEYILNNNVSVSGKAIYEFTQTDIEKWVKSLNDLKDTPEKNIKDYIEGRYAEVLAVVDRAIELKKGFKLRDTQKLSALILLVNKSNTLEQISTGEGKSLIVVTVSIIKALCGEKVDIITSSSVLAKRDAEENRSIYKLFNVAVSHNCDEMIDKRKVAYSNNQVVYGDLSNFQRDYLLDRFYKKNILGNRTFDNIIVDEVDSMLLDKGNNMLYLSHDLSGLDKLESIYIYIWQLVNKPSGNFEDFRHSFDTKVIKEEVLYDLYGFINEEDMKRVDGSLSKEEAAVLWGCLVDANILDNRGRLLSKENFTIDQILKLLPEKYSCCAAGLHYLIGETINRDKFIDIPNYLKTFVEDHLDSWINNARIASFMQERYDYIVDVDRSGTSCDRNPQIIILDRDTGTDQNNSQWDEALHQFLQLKHGCKLSLQSLKAVFVSNVSYLKLYSNLYGLSGTLGSHGERKLLEDIYKVDFVIVPTAKMKQFYEMKPILCNDKEEWIDEICKMAKKLTVEKLRSILIICETVKDVEKLYTAFGGKLAENVHTYLRDYEEFDIAKGDKEMDQKQIIIATNLAGRGTDIKITRELSEAGGLHVCLTYLPNNTRIEQQAFGRAARSGKKGSGQLIIISPEEKQIFRLKKQRNAEELCRISRIKDHYETQTLVEEKYFSIFKEQYEKLDKHLDKSNTPDNLKIILLQCCLDEWAFWLDRNSKHIRNKMSEKKNEILEESIDVFIEKLQSKCKQEMDWAVWVKDHPYHMLKLGLYLAQTKIYDKAIDLFDKIIKQESDFSMTARYYRAFVIAKTINWEKKDKYKQEIKEFKEELREVSKRLEILQGNRLRSASVIQKLNECNNEGIIKIDAYATQQSNINEILSAFLKSIDDIFGHPINSQHFVGYNIKETSAVTLYEDMIEMGILKRPKVKKRIPEVTLNKLSYDYDIPIEKLSAFLDMFKGKEINEQSFLKEFKKAIVMPNRETFWKLLIAKEVLTDERIYVLVNKDKLNDWDPSLLNKLVTGKTNDKSIDNLTNTDVKRIFLYVEKVDADKDTMILEKYYIKRMIGEDKYHLLKRQGVFSSTNKVAHVNTEKAKSISFPQYDSITKNDFNKISITMEEAEKILAELVDKKILVSDDADNSVYRLIASYSTIHQFELLFHPVYENSVKTLLLVCFAYRIALQRMIEDLTKDDNESVRLQLVVKPHKDLFCSLIDEGIVKPVKVTTECVDMVSILNEKYPQKMSKPDIMDRLKRSKLIPYEFCNEELWNDLINKQWIFTCSLFKDGTVSFTDLYSINNFRNARLSLDSTYKDMEETLHVIMDNMVKLSQDETITNIVSILEQLRSSLKTLECPDPQLKPLLETDVTNFANVQELRVFFLNGFDQLLTLEEKKWTRKMLLNTGLVIVIGICQITAGVLIELYSVGIMTHVGAGFISEGISDLIFASSALLSGHFSWKDYRQHKIQSLMTTVVTLGIGMYFSRGVKVSHFGHKVGGTSLQVGQKKVSEMAGKELFQAIAKSSMNAAGVSLTKEVFKRVTLKVLEGLAFGLTNASIDLLIQKYLHSFCDSLTFTMLSDVQKKVKEHPVSSTLRECCKLLGKEGASKMINDITKVMSKEKTYADKLLSTCSQISVSIMQGMSQAAEKISKKNSNMSGMALSLNTISKVFTCIEATSHIAKITQITDEYLNKMEKEIREQLNYKISVKSNIKPEVTDEECDDFVQEITDRWKLLLRQKAEQIIAQQIVGPILKGFARKLVGHLGKLIKHIYRSTKEVRYYEQFQKTRREYKNKLKEILEKTDVINKDEIVEQIKKEYENHLVQLMVRTRNSALFADIVEEGVPMDSICLKACVKIIPKALKKKGINVESFTLNVEGENCVLETVSSDEKTHSRCINLNLRNNHFTLCDDYLNNNESDKMSSSNSEDESRNNCLFNALRRAIPELNNLTADEFRKHIADYIKNDPDIKYYLSQAWHRLPLALNFRGGDRRETKKITSKELQKKIKDGTFKFSQSSIATHTQDGVDIGELSEDIEKNKWKGKPVRVVENSESNYTALDHRRVLAVAISDNPNVEMEIAIYGPDDEFSSENNDNLQWKENTDIKSKHEKTAGGLAKKRMRSGSLDNIDSLDGFISDQVRIRLRPSNSEGKKDYGKQLEDLGYQVGGPKRNKKGNNKRPRSKSSSR